MELPWNLLILPLLGGYWFSHSWYRTRFELRQLPSAHIAIYSATYGAALLLISFVVAEIFEVLLKSWNLIDRTANLRSVVEAHFHLDHLPDYEFLGVSTAAAALGPFIGRLLNKNEYLRKVEKEERKKNNTRTLRHKAIKSQATATAIQKFGDPMENMLLFAQSAARPVLLTMSNGKVYQASVIELPANLDGKLAFFTVAPQMSGYRDPKTKNVTMDTDYQQMIDTFESWDEQARRRLPEATLRLVSLRDSKRLDKDNAWVEYDLEHKTRKRALEKVLRSNDIESCSIFEDENWKTFQGTSDDSGMQ